MILKTAFEKLFNIRDKARRSRPGADDGFDAHEKPFLDHLEDLRVTCFKILGTLVISTVLAFTFHVEIFELLQWPAKMTEVSEGVTLYEKINFITLAPPEILMLMLRVAFFAAVIVTFPITIFFLFEFIVPGLRQNEKKMVRPGVGIGFLLFLAGAAFAFFLASPIALKFFYTFQIERISVIDPTAAALDKPLAELPLIGVNGKEYRPAAESTESKDTPENEDAAESGKPKPASLSLEMKEQMRNYVVDLFAVQEGTNLVFRYDESRDKLVILQSKGALVTYQIGEYIKFVTRLTLVFGLAFQLPVIVTILVKLELLTAKVMQSTRTYAWIIIMVAAAILTPPDVMTLGLLAGPMIILYEICIIIARIIERKRAKKELAEEKEYRERMSSLHDKNPEDLTEEEKEELHKREIEQYEKEHAHLYLEDSEHKNDEGDDADDDVFHTGPSPGDHDESWHEDHQYWHDGHEDDKHHDGEDKPDEPKQDWPDKENLAADGMESDHSEKEAEDPHAPEYYEGCEPEGPVVDLNHADKEELITLKGIGPALADAIIENRPYDTFDDVEKVPGISPNKLSKMIDRILLG